MKTILNTIIIFTLCLAIGKTSQAQFGTLDATFSGNGIFVESGASSLGTVGVEDIHVYNDGSVLYLVKGYIVSNSTYKSFLMKVKSDGTKETSFGTNGNMEITVGILDNIELTSMDVQADGKIVVGGVCELVASRYSFVARVLADGSGLDNLFAGGNGYATNNWRSTTTTDFMLEDVKVKSNGKIVAVGYSYNPLSTVQKTTMTAWQLNSDGTDDNNFASSGKYRSAEALGTFDSRGHCVSFNSAGDIFIGGSANTDVEPTPLLHRITSSGAPQNSFGSNSFLLASLTEGAILDMTHLANDDLVYTGYTKPSSTEAMMAGSVLANGTADFSYVLSGGDSRSNSIAIDAQDKIYLGGKIASTSGKDKFAIVRLTSAGVADNSWGTNGLVQTEISATHDDYITTMAFNANLPSSIFVGGISYDSGYLGKYKIAWPTAISDIYKDTKLNVYPNPSSKIINIKLAGINEKDASATVYSVLGEKLLTQKINTNLESKMDVSHLAKGQYIVYIQDNELRTIAAQKISVQ